MEQPTVTLGYWDTRGLAERIRHLLEYLAIPYTEVKYAGNEGRAKWFDQTKPATALTLYQVTAPGAPVLKLVGCSSRFPSPSKKPVKSAARAV